MDLITITSRQGMLEEKETLILKRTEESAPNKFENKKYVFISCRVHPGEVAASHMLNGFLDFILGSFEGIHDDPIAKDLLDTYVFLVVPILNPDGVYRGHYRADTNGLNLNRMYATCTPSQTPTISAVHSIVTSLSSPLFLYLDFHAHASIRNVFIFGNALPFPSHIGSCLYALLVSLQCPWFDLLSSNFSSSNMVRDVAGRGEMEGGSGRVVALKDWNVERAYTVESNYLGGSRIGHGISFKQDPQLLAPEQREWKNAEILREEKNVVYGMREWRDVGKSLAIGMIGMVDKHDDVFLKNTPFKDFRTLKLFLAYLLAGENPNKSNLYLRCLLDCKKTDRFTPSTL